MKLKATPTAYATDFQNNFYLGFPDGSFIKYDSEAKHQENFSLPNKSAISLIDVQNNLKPFLFYFDIQQITLLDRFSTVPKQYALSEFGIQIAMMACPASDGDFWMIESNPQRLKKINPLRKNTLLEVPLLLGDSIRKMQAYQNLLLICDENSINAFDQFGSFVYKVDQKGLTNFQLVQGHLFAYTETKQLQIELFSGRVISSDELPSKSKGTLKLQKKLAILRDDHSLVFYSFR